MHSHWSTKLYTILDNRQEQEHVGICIFLSQDLHPLFGWKVGDVLRAHGTVRLGVLIVLSRSQRYVYEWISENGEFGHLVTFVFSSILEGGDSTRP